jgi:hypothetical protein
VTPVAPNVKRNVRYCFGRKGRCAPYHTPRKEITTMTGKSPLIAPNNGVKMPALGVGVFPTAPEQTVGAVFAGC